MHTASTALGELLQCLGELQIILNYELAKNMCVNMCERSAGNADYARILNEKLWVIRKKNKNSLGQ